MVIFTCEQLMSTKSHMKWTWLSLSEMYACNNNNNRKNVMAKTRMQNTQNIPPVIKAICGRLFAVWLCFARKSKVWLSHATYCKRLAVLVARTKQKCRATISLIAKRENFCNYAFSLAQPRAHYFAGAVNGSLNATAVVKRQAICCWFFFLISFRFGLKVCSLGWATNTEDPSANRLSYCQYTQWMIWETLGLSGWKFFSLVFYFLCYTFSHLFDCTVWITN